MKDRDYILKIEQELLTYEHDSFFKVKLFCQHEYYQEGVCKDIALELTQASKDLLKKYGFFIKEEGHSLLVGRRRTNNAKDKAFNSILPPAFPKVVLLIKVINGRFWLVTDFEASSKGYDHKAETPLVFQNKGKALSCAGADPTVFSTLPKEHFTGLRKEPVKGVPKEKNALLPVFSKDVFAVIVLDLNQIKGRAQDLSLSMQASAIKLRYKVAQKKTLRKSHAATKKLSVADVLIHGEELTEFSPGEENSIRLSIKHLKDSDSYVLESQDLWRMRQENKHQSTNFFKFEVAVKNSKKGGEGKAEVFLPFPNRIHPGLFKKEGKLTVIEQNVQLLRFAAKPSPVN